MHYNILHNNGSSPGQGAIVLRISSCEMDVDIKLIRNIFKISENLHVLDSPACNTHVMRCMQSLYLQSWGVCVCVCINSNLSYKYESKKYFKICGLYLPHSVDSAFICSFLLLSIFRGI